MKRKGKTCAVWALLTLVLFAQCASQPPVFSEAEWLQRIQAADSSLLYASNVTEEGVFYNPWLQRHRTQKSGSWFFHKREKYEKLSRDQYGPVSNDYSYLSDNNFDSITFAGHASMIIKMDGQCVFTDPFFSNAALIAPKKEKIKFDFSKVPEKPVVLISHNHYDHLDKYSVQQLAKKDAVFIVPLGLQKTVAGYGAKEIHELDWWQSVKIGAIEYTLLPAQHWSRRIGQGGGKTLWGGFLIRGSRTVYFSGDTGYFNGFKEFASRWEIDYAILGAGAYEPRWFMHYSHMNIVEFLRAADDLKAKYAIPMHFGVISLSDEPLFYPLFEIENAVKENPLIAEKVRPLRVGEYLRIQ
ncbi:MAG: MBL fold metallo-hydrolase [Treponema sp.]|jgi:N-acyl-phosphatidylethanolamine-hydrolysing phospholipase D|nr:MBL fold metallo-hydrolase [Treponema sp.]